jgi:hypothetical protein
VTTPTPRPPHPASQTASGRFHRSQYRQLTNYKTGHSPSFDSSVFLHSPPEILLPDWDQLLGRTMRTIGRLLVHPTLRHHRLCTIRINKTRRVGTAINVRAGCYVRFCQWVHIMPHPQLRILHPSPIVIFGERIRHLFPCLS